MSRAHDLSKYHKRSEPCEFHKDSELFTSRDLSETCLDISNSPSPLYLTNSLSPTDWRQTMHVPTDSSIKHH